MTSKTPTRFYKFQPKKFQILPNGGKFIPLGRSGHEMVAIRNDMYVFGGYNPAFEEGSQGFKTLWRLSLATMQWEQIFTRGTFPDQMLSCVSFKIKNTMYIHGGTSVPFGDNVSNVLYKLNIDGYTADFEAVSSEILQSYGHTITVDEKRNHLYVFGGTVGKVYLNDFKIVNATKWKTSSTQQAPGNERYKHTSVLDSDLNFLVFGGCNAEQIFSLKELLIFPMDFKKRGLATLVITLPDRKTGKFPVPRFSHSGFQVPWDENEYVICGGTGENGPLNDIWSINLITKQWKLWPTSLPAPLYFHTTSILPSGRVMIFGGNTVNELGVTRTNQVLSCWIKIPTLAEIALEAIFFYFPQVSSMSLSELLDCKFSMKLLRKLKFYVET